MVGRPARPAHSHGLALYYAANAADAVYKAGLLQFPESAFLHIAYSSFLIRQRGAAQVAGWL